MTTLEVAEHFGISLNRTYKLKQEYGLPFVKSGGKNHFELEAITAWAKTERGRIALAHSWVQPEERLCSVQDGGDNDAEYITENCKMLLVAIVIQAIKDYRQNKKNSTVRRFLQDSLEPQQLKELGINNEKNSRKGDKDS